MTTGATVVEVDRRTVGIAVPSGKGFRFFAADSSFLRLDRQRFRRLTDLERAVRDTASDGECIGS